MARNRAKQPSAEQGSEFPGKPDRRAPGIAIIFDADGRVYTFEQAAPALFGHARESFPCLHFESLFPAPASGDEPSSSLFAQLSEMGGRQLALTARRRDGSTFPALVQLTHLPGGERLTHLCIVRDSPHLEAGPHQGGRPAGEAGAAGGTLRGEFLASMGHELRTPLTAIIGFLKLVEDGHYSSEAVRRDYVGNARQSALSLLELINNILDLARLEAGRLTLERVDFDLAELVEEVTKALAPVAHGKGVEIECVVDGAIPGRVKGDRVRLRQVLYNLVGNAVKFTDSGLVLLRAELESSDEKGCHTRFAVTDTGIGVDEALQPLIFESFVQTGHAYLDKLDGVGLGLSISKQIVDQMGGTIRLKSKRDQGSTFWFVVPLERARAEAGERPESDATLQSQRVLLLNPDAATRPVYAEKLAALGLASEAVSSSAEAARLLARAEKEHRPVRAVLVDHSMKLEGALVFARRVRRERGSFQPDLVHLSPIGAVSNLQALSDAGYTAYLTKPVMPAGLSGTLGSLFARQSADGVPALQPVEPLSEPAGGSESDQHGIRVLVVEDNPVNQKLMNALLSRKGYVTTLVSNGQEAVDAVARTHFDLVLMDVQMPVMDGLTATRAIREQFGQDDLPIIAMTAGATDGDRERCIGAGMNDYVAKPIMPDILERKMREWIHTATAGQGKFAAGNLAPAPVLPALDLPHLEGVRAYANAHAAGRFEEWVGLFVAELRQAMGDLATARRRGDRPAAREATRRIFLVCGGFGAPHLRELAREMRQEMQQAPDEHARARLQDLLPEMESAWRGMERELKQRFGLPDEKGSAPPAE
ncbi:MAG: response regulator [SAR324 cluster bacterium]|nr:response regulator [SAR324 cluster bacterium]